MRVCLAAADSPKRARWAARSARLATSSLGEALVSLTTTECCCYYYSSLVSCEVRQQDAQQVVGAGQRSSGGAARRLADHPSVGMRSRSRSWLERFRWSWRATKFMTKEGTQHVESLTVRREAPIADPNWITATSGEVNDVRRLFASGIPNTRRARELARSSRAGRHLILLERIDFPCRPCTEYAKYEHRTDREGS